MEVHVFRGAYLQKEICFKIDWATLIVGRKFTILLCFTWYLRAISKYKPPGASIWRGDLWEGFLRYELGGGGLIFGGAYTWRGLFLEFYSNFTKNSAAAEFRLMIILSW